MGDTDYFEVDSSFDEPELRIIGNSSAGTHRIFREVVSEYGKWEFSVRFDGFTSSNQNRVWVWLAVENPENPTGYALRIGENGAEKYVRLFQIDGGNPGAEIMRSAIPLQAGDKHRIIIERGSDNVWRLGMYSASEDNYVWSTSDNINKTTAANLMGVLYFGYNVEFTTTRSDRFTLGRVATSKLPIFAGDIVVRDPMSLEVLFSEKFPSDYDSDEIDWSINNFTGDGELEISGRILLLKLSNTLTGGEYGLTLSNIRDPVSGELINNPELLFRLFDQAGLMDIVISEFAPRPIPGILPPFLELYNKSEKYLDINGWKIGRNSASGVITLSNNDGAIPVAPNSFVVISNDLAFYTLPDSIVKVSSNLPSLNRNSDSIWLRNTSNTLIDSISYDARFTHLLVDGYSIERVDQDYTALDPVNWSVNSDRHSAGRENLNSAKISDDIKLLIAGIFANNDAQIHFDKYVRKSELLEIRINGQPVSFNEVSDLGSAKIRVSDYGTVINLNPQVLDLEINGVFRFGSENINYFVSELAQQPGKGDLVINEIMYQPIQERYSSVSDQSEYVELKNITNRKLMLDNVYLHDTPDKNGSVRRWDIINNNHWFIEPAGYTVIYADTAKQFNNTRIGSYFGLTNMNWGRVDRQTLGLTSSGRGVYLSTNLGIAIDSVYYSPDWHHPYVTDTRGISLEKVQPSYTVIGDNWISSAHPLGGTPGKRNSVAIEETPQNGVTPGLYLYPNPFSPDRDSHEDLLSINLKLPGIGYLTTMNIYDRFGRPVRQLMSAIYSGNEVNFIWDGRDSNKNLCTSGVYILHVRAVEPVKKQSVEYKKPVVIVRRK